MIYRFLDGTDCEKQVPIAHHARPGFHLGGLGVDQSFLFQLPNVLGDRVSAQASVFANLSNTGPALMGIPIFTKN